MRGGREGEHLNAGDIRNELLGNERLSNPWIVNPNSKKKDKNTTMEHPGDFLCRLHGHGKRFLSLRRERDREREREKERKRERTVISLRAKNRA